MTCACIRLCGVCLRRVDNALKQHLARVRVQPYLFGRPGPSWECPPTTSLSATEPLDEMVASRRALFGSSIPAAVLESTLDDNLGARDGQLGLWGSSSSMQHCAEAEFRRLG